MWSEKLGRKRAIIIASLLALPIIPLMGIQRRHRFCLALGGFFMQVKVQGTWGIIPGSFERAFAAPLARSLFPALPISWAI